MKDLIHFDFRGKGVRTVMRDGQPWFVLADVCRVLEIGNNRDAAARLDDDEKADVDITDTSSNGTTQRRAMTIINESGLYSLILTSRKPQAQPFKRWVTHDVLPTLRQHGTYTMPDRTAVVPTEPDWDDVAAVVEDDTAQISERALRSWIDIVREARLLRGRAAAVALWAQSPLPPLPGGAGPSTGPAGFIGEWLRPAEGQRLRFPAIYRAYCRWCGERGDPPAGKRQVGQAIRAAGFVCTRSDGIVVENAAFR